MEVELTMPLKGIIVSHSEVVCNFDRFMGWAEEAMRSPTLEDNSFPIMLSHWHGIPQQPIR